MGTYYVNSTTGDDANDGSSGSPWETVGKALAALNDGSDHTVMVEPGNYYNEGASATYPNPNGGEVTVIADGGTCNLRRATTSAFSWAWWSTATAGSSIIFQGHFNFELDAPLQHWMQGNNTDASWEFDGCEFSGAKGWCRGSGLQNVTLKRCHIHDMTTYLFLLKGGDHVIESCFIDNVSEDAWVFGDIDSLELRNNTVRDCMFAQNTSETVTTIKVINNLFVRDARATGINLSQSITNFTVNNNCGHDESPSAPRSPGDYGYVTISHADYADVGLYLDPDFDTTEPALESTSLLIGRGTSSDAATNAFTLVGSGESTFSASLPMIGCWAPPASWSKRTITKTDKKVAITGDSITDGLGLGSQSYPNVVEASLTDFAFIKMPGSSPAKHLGISGAGVETCSKMASEFVWREQPEIVTVFIGVNDLGGGGRTVAWTRDNIIKMLDMLADLGVKVIYTGCSPVSANPASTDVTDSLAVEDAVHTHCQSNGYGSARVCNTFVDSAGWPPAGYYDPADYLHPNSTGHAKIAEVLELEILAQDVTGTGGGGGALSGSLTRALAPPLTSKLSG